jgi:hypothetical protein
MLALIPEVTKQRSEFAIAVAEIKIAFVLLKKLINFLWIFTKLKAFKVI